MKQHHYQITVQELPNLDGDTSINEKPITFKAGSHDDLHDIVSRIKKMDGFSDESATAFAVSLKLFGGVMLEHRNSPLFAEFAPHFGQFMRLLKSTSKNKQETALSAVPSDGNPSV